MQTQTLEKIIKKIFEVAEKQSGKKISGGFLEQKDYGFSEKLKFHEPEISHNSLSILKSKLHGRIQEYILGKLTDSKKEFGDIPSTPLLDQIIQSKKSRYIFSQEITNKASNVYYPKKTKHLKSLFSISGTMERQQEYEQFFERELQTDLNKFMTGQKGYSWRKLREEAQQKYTLSMDEIPNERDLNKYYEISLTTLNNRMKKFIENEEVNNNLVENLRKNLESRRFFW